MAFITMLFVLLTNDLFVADASTQVSYNVELSRESLKHFVDDIGLFARNMPGVVEVKPLGAETYLYRTEKEIPLAGTMQTDFVIEKVVQGDTVTIYRSKDASDPNYMSCKVRMTPLDDTRTMIEIALRIRLSRVNASEIHWLAPILGEGFISDRMTGDLEEMLEEFIERSNRELYGQLAIAAGGN